MKKNNRKVVRLSESKIKRIVAESVRKMLKEMGTPRQNALLKKLVGDDRYENLSIKDASEKIGHLLQNQPKRMMTEPQLKFLKKLSNNRLIRRCSEAVVLLDMCIENSDKISVGLASNVINTFSDYIKFRRPNDFYYKVYGLLDKVSSEIGVSNPHGQTQTEPQVQPQPNLKDAYQIFPDTNEPDSYVEKSVRAPFCYAHGMLEDDMKTDLFTLDEKFRENLNNDGFATPGAYKCQYNGKPCTLYVGSGYPHVYGLVCYDDDVEAKKYIVDSLNLKENRKRNVVRMRESKLKQIVAESVRQILTEDQTASSIRDARNLLMQKRDMSKEEADKFIRIELRNDIPVLRSKQGGKFILGVTRMFVNNELTDASTINGLNSTLKYVASDAHINEYDRNLNGMSANDLIERFATARTNDLEAERKNLVNRYTF